MREIDIERQHLLAKMRCSYEIVMSGFTWRKLNEQKIIVINVQIKQRAPIFFFVKPIASHRSNWILELFNERYSHVVSERFKYAIRHHKLSHVIWLGNNHIVHKYFCISKRKTEGDKERWFLLKMFCCYGGF